MQVLSVFSSNSQHASEGHIPQNGLTIPSLQMRSSYVTDMVGRVIGWRLFLVHSMFHYCRPAGC